MLALKGKETSCLVKDSDITHLVNLETYSNRTKVDQITWFDKNEDLLKKERIFNNLPLNTQKILGSSFINHENITVEKLLAICWWDELIINEFWKENLLSEHMTVSKIKATCKLWSRKIKAIKWTNIAKKYMTIEKITILLYQDCLDIDKIIAIGWDIIASPHMTTNKIIAIRDYLSVYQINAIWWLLLSAEEFSEEYIRFLWMHFSPTEITIFWIENILIWLINSSKNEIRTKKIFLIKTLRIDILKNIWWLLLRNPKISEKTILEISNMDRENCYSANYLLDVKKKIINNDSNIISYFW